MLRTLGNAYSDLHQTPEALKCYQERLALARETKSRTREAVSLTDLGTFLLGIDRNTEAIENFSNALEIERTDGQLADAAKSLTNLAVVNIKIGKWPEAKQNLEECLKIARDLKLTSTEALALEYLGTTHQRLGKFDDALKYLAQSLKLQKTIGDRYRQGECLSEMGNSQMKLGRFEEATTNFQDAMTIRRQIGDRKRIAMSLMDLGQVANRTGRLNDARRLFEESLTISRGLKYLEGESICLEGLAHVNGDLGHSEIALKQYEEALAITRRLGSRSNEAIALGSVADALSRLGRYAEALQHHRESLKISRDVGNRHAEAVSLVNLAVLNVRMGRTAEAVILEQEALAIFREIGARPAEAHALLNVGDSYRRLNHPEEALNHNAAALKIAREIKQRTTEARALWGIGMIHAAADKPAEALTNFEMALGILREIGDRRGEGGLRQNIGLAHAKAGKFDDAREQLRVALAISRESADRVLEVKTHSLTGYVQGETGDWKGAAESFATSIKIVESLRVDTRDPSLQASLFDEHSGVFFGLAWAQLKLDRAADAFATSEQYRSRSLVDLLSGAKIDVRKGMTASERKTDEEIQARLTMLDVQIQDLRGRKAGPERIGPLVKELEKARREFDSFRQDLYLRDPEIKTRHAQFAPASLVELNKLLFVQRPDVAVLSYLVGKDDTLLFVLTRGEKADGPARLAIHRIEAKYKVLTEAVESFRSRCLEPTRTPNSADLYRWLLAPAEEVLKNAKHVVIIPDGPLQTLPFQALRAGEEGPYLVERFSISGAPSITALLKMQELGDRLRKQHAKNSSLLAVGIGDFGKRQKPLPQAEEESRAVATLFGDRAKTLLGGEATRSRLQASWTLNRYLHFATHGLLNEASPFYSSIVLSQGGGRDDPGQLFARDLLEADLAAELVVLSACETGLGQQVSGEGLLGMSWSWFVAGVPSLVSSQWQVADAATAALMKAFWTEIKAGTNRAEALRKAQIGLLKERKTRHPFFWAPFMLIGEFGS